MPTCKRCRTTGCADNWGRYRRNGRLKVLCPACDEQAEAWRNKSAEARAAGYPGWANTPEYKRKQREATALREGRVLAPYIPQSERGYRAQMLRAERLAQRIRTRWAMEWLKPFRAALYQSDPVFREEHKARSRAEYWARLDENRMKTVRYKRNHPDRASCYQARRNRRISEASDGTLTPELITALKRRARHCAYCGLALFSPDKVTDHMIPLCLGGEHSLHNLVICCRLCNGRKASLAYHEWVDRIEPEHRTRVVALYEHRYGMRLEAIA